MRIPARLPVRPTLIDSLVARLYVRPFRLVKAPALLQREVRAKAVGVAKDGRRPILYGVPLSPNVAPLSRGQRLVALPLGVATGRLSPVGLVVRPPLTYRTR